MPCPLWLTLPPPSAAPAKPGSLLFLQHIQCAPIPGIVDPLDCPSASSGHLPALLPPRALHISTSNAVSWAVFLDHLYKVAATVPPQPHPLLSCLHFSKVFLLLDFMYLFVPSSLPPPSGRNISSMKADILPCFVYKCTTTGI